MRLSSRLVLAGLIAVVTMGCGRRVCETAAMDESAAPAQGAAADPGGNSDGTRAIAEADVVQLDHEQNYVYAMSKSGALAVVDASTPRTLALLGKTSLAGEPFEMYRRGSVLLTMANHAVAADGSPRVTLDDGATAPLPETVAGSSAVVSAVDVSDPSNMHTLATLTVPGDIADSRIVGNVLYLATYENGACYYCSGSLQTRVTSFDVSDPTAPKLVDQISFESPTNAGFNAAWSTPWKRSIFATDQRVYVGGLASDATTTTDEGVVEVIDITDPSGHLVRGATVTTAGPIMSRWQMDELDGVFRIVSQRGAGRTSNGEAYPDVDTFRIESSSSLVRLGHMTLSLPRQEGLKTVRFDGARAYAITFNQTDPLFTIDLGDASKPKQVGELHMPGWMYHLEPHGNYVVGLGLDRTDTSGNLNVSIFDVTDLASPTLLQRVSFGPTNLYEDYQITNGVLAEDQDRIQKAFRVFDDGLIAVPYSAPSTDGSTCGRGGGVQLLDWQQNRLTRRALLPVSGNARRAIRRDTSDGGKELIAVSDSNVTAFDIHERDTVDQTADVVIGTCVQRSTPNGMPVGGGDRGYEGYDVAYGSCE